MIVNFGKKTSKIAWGFFWLLLAGLVLANYFEAFGDVNLSVWRIIIAVIAAIVLFHNILSLSFSSMPIPLAALYWVFWEVLGLPEVRFWTLALVTLLVTIGLNIMLPKRFRSVNAVNVNVKGNKKRKKKENRFDLNMEDGDVIINGDFDEVTEKTKIEEGDDVNNPYISVSFGSACRYLHSDSLESADLNCSFGNLEVYFDNVTLSPNGAEVEVNCSFGNIELYVPSHWHVKNEISSSLANAEVSKHLRNNDSDAPTMTVTGSVSLGNVEVNRIKGS